MIDALYRFPIKGLSGQALPEATLKAGQGFPFDRQYALALPSTKFDEAKPAPFPKTKFLMLMKNEKLAEFRTQISQNDHLLKITDRADTPLIQADVTQPSGKLKIENFFYDIFRDVLPAAPRLVQASGHIFTDISVVSTAMMNAISLINLASVRDLEKATGKSIDPMRFRGNIIFDNGKPWSEFEWMGQSLNIGGAQIKGVMRTQRCPATQVNPATALRDIDVPAELKTHFGHADMGIYADVIQAGTISLGDDLSLSN